LENIVGNSKPKTNKGSHRTSNKMSTFPLNHHESSADVRNYLKHKAEEAGYKIEKFQVSERTNADFDIEKYNIYKRMAGAISFVRKTYSTKEEMFAAFLKDYDYDWFKKHTQKKPKKKVEKPKRRETKTIHTKPKHCTGEIGSEETRCYWRMVKAEQKIRLGQAVKEDYCEYWHKRSKYGGVSKRERTLDEKNDGIGREPYQHDWPLPPPPPALMEEKTLTLHERLLRIGLKPPSELPPPPADFWD